MNVAQVRSKFGPSGHTTLLKAKTSPAPCLRRLSPKLALWFAFATIGVGQEGDDACRPPATAEAGIQRGAGVQLNSAGHGPYDSPLFFPSPFPLLFRESILAIARYLASQQSIRQVREPSAFPFLPVRFFILFGLVCCSWCGPLC